MKTIVPTSWSPNLAYVIGLITTDGCLSKDGRHIDFTSKDLDQIQAFTKILGLKNKIGLKSSGSSNARKYYRVQFGNVKFYRFLLSIGLTPHKSKTITRIKVPDRYFQDFMRGCLDGDGYIYTYWDKIYKNSFRLYIGFTSGSLKHLEWIRLKLNKLYHIEGRIRPIPRAYRLILAKKSSIALLKILYYKEDLVCLQRKLLKFQSALGIINAQAGMGKLVNPLP